MARNKNSCNMKQTRNKKPNYKNKLHATALKTLENGKVPGA